jgi:hypothetical protein
MREDDEGRAAGEAEAFQVGLQVALHCLRDLRQLGKGGEGNAVVSDNSLIKRVAAVAEGSHLTVDTGVCLRAYCTL